MILPVTIPIDLPSGGLLEIEVELRCVWYEPEGNGWNEPRIEACWQLDYYEVTGATWHHADDSDTTIRTPPDMFVAVWLEHFMDKRSDLLVEAMKQALLTERVW